MEYDIPDLLKRMKPLVKGGQTGLADRLSEKGGLKVSQSDVSRWLKGVKPNGPNTLRIVGLAHELGLIGDVRSEDVAVAQQDLRSEDIAVSLRRVVGAEIDVIGYVGASGYASYFQVDSPAYLETIPARNSENASALRIMGDSLGKLFNRWYVIFNDARSPVTEDMINELCVVGLDDDRVLVKKLERSRFPSRGFDLVSNVEDEPVISHVNVVWAAKVLGIRPR